MILPKRPLPNPPPSSIYKQIRQITAISRHPKPYALNLIYVHMYTHVHKHIYMHMYKYTCICIFIYIYTCKNAYACAYTYVYIHTHVYIYIYIQDQSLVPCFGESIPFQRLWDFRVFRVWGQAFPEAVLGFRFRVEGVGYKV